MKSANGTDISNSSVDDDDLDLEALRVAALESLRAKGLPPPPVKPALVPRAQETAPFVYRQHSVNQNLISIIPIDAVSTATDQMPETRNEAMPLKSLLPSKAVSSGVSEDEDKPKVPSKFSRYEDSDSEESDEFDIGGKDSEPASDSDECELEIGETEDLLLRSPSPPSAVNAGHKEEPAVKNTDPDANKPVSSSEQKVEKPKVEIKQKNSEKTKSDKTSVESSKQRERARSPDQGSKSTSRHQKSSSRRSPGRHSSSRVKDSSPKHRSRNQTRRSRSRSPHRSRKVSPKRADDSKPKQGKSEELDRLEARKRKFEASTSDGNLEVKPRKIKLNAESENRPNERKENKKKKKRQSASPEPKLEEEKKVAAETRDEANDLRAELQRRRINRGLVKETTQQPSSNEGSLSSSDSRRILVIKPKTATPEPESEASGGKPSIRERLGAADESPSKSQATNRIKLKRPVSAAPAVETDKGSHVEELEDRIRRIQAMNDALLKRHLELEADKLLFA